MKKQAIRLIVIGACAFSATAVLAEPQEASAWTRRVQASACRPNSDDHGSNVFVGAVFRSFVATSFTCDVPLDSNTPYTAASVVNVHGFLPAGATAWSRACTKHSSTAGTTCGVIKDWGTGFAGAQSVSPSPWVSTSQYPYLIVNFTAVAAGVGSEFFGFYTSG